MATQRQRTARGGYFDTWLLHGSTWWPFSVAFSLSGSRTDGYELTVEADAQTRLDRLFNTRASLAPGRLNNARDNLDMRLNLSTEHARFRFGYVGLLNAEDGVGFANALDPDGRSELSTLTADLTYRNQLTSTLE